MAADAAGYSRLMAADERARAAALPEYRKRIGEIFLATGVPK
ncbi:MAG: hypothetical protein ACXWJA_14280 [Caldimonas sp.]